MKHPNDEQWMAFLYGEASSADRNDLQSHLAQCRTCTEHVTAFRSTMRSLDQWEIDEPSQPAARAAGVLRWSAAAIFLVGLGFLLGRATGVSRGDLNSLRVEITEVARASAESTVSQQVHALQEAWRTGRRTDWRLLEEILQQQRKEQQSIRRDLETVALTAEEAIARTHQDIRQFVSFDSDQFSPRTEERP